MTCVLFLVRFKNFALTIYMGFYWSYVHVLTLAPILMRSCSNTINSEAFSCVGSQSCSQTPSTQSHWSCGSGYETLGTSLHKTWKKCTLLFSEAHCKQLESRVEKLVDLQDVEDELQHCRESLAVAERSLARWVHLITRTSHTSLHAVLVSCSTNLSTARGRALMTKQ